MTQTIRDEVRGRVIDENGAVVDEFEPEQRDEFRMLSVYRDEQPVEDKVDWLGTISSGFKNAQGYPEASRDGVIHLSDPDNRCAKLAELLEASGGKKLTIALVSNSIEEIIHQRYVLYSRTSLVAHGDLFEMVAFEDSGKKDTKNEPIMERRVYPVGTPGYKLWREKCKVSWSLFFVVAAWDGPRSTVRFPDGFGQYRLRSGSPHSLANAVGKLKEIGKLTNGRLAGIPLDLSIGYRDVAGPDGKRRNIPVWNFALRPPDMIELNSGNFREIIGGALAEGSRLHLELPAPTPESWERGEMADVSATMEPRMEASSEDLDRVQTPDVKCDPLRYEAAFFASVRGSYLDSDSARAQFVAEMSGTATTSLAEFLAGATIAEADRMILTVNERVRAARELAMKAGLADKSRIDTSGVPPQAAGGDGSLVAPPPQPIDAPVIELGAISDSSTSTDVGKQEVVDHPPTVADAVAPPPAPPSPPETPDKPRADNPLRQAADDASAARKDLEAEWGKTWKRANQAGLKDFTKINGATTDDELRAAIATLNGRIREKERNDGSVDERDLAGDQPPPVEGATDALPF